MHCVFDVAEDQQQDPRSSHSRGGLKRAKQHFDFCVDLCNDQAKAGRYLLHEHPAYANSRQIEIIEDIMRDDGVVKATCD